MAADSLSVHSATTCALISFIKSMKALSGFFMWFFFFSSGGWWPEFGPPPPYWSKELFLQCIKVEFTILPYQNDTNSFFLAIQNIRLLNDYGFSKSWNFTFDKDKSQKINTIVFLWKRCLIWKLECLLVPYRLTTKHMK